MSAAAVRRAVRSGAPAHGSLSKLAAPVRSPVVASVKRVSPAPCIAAAPARSASLPCATGRGNGTLPSPDSYGSLPNDVFSYLKATQDGTSHVLRSIDNTAWGFGFKNVPKELVGRFVDIDFECDPNGTRKGFYVKRGPNMRIVSKTKARIPVITHAVYGGERHLVQRKVWISCTLRKDGCMEFRIYGLKKCLGEMGAQPGDWLLVSMTLQGDQLAMELKVLQQAAVTDKMLDDMERFLVDKPVAPKPRGQKANTVTTTAAGPKSAAAPAAACDQQQQQQQEEEEEEEDAKEAAAPTTAAPCAAPRATRKQQQEKAKQGAKPTAAPAPFAATKASSDPPAASGSVERSLGACGRGNCPTTLQNFHNNHSGSVEYNIYNYPSPQHARAEGSATCCCCRCCCCCRRS